MNNFEEKSDHELLMELVAEKRRNEKIRYIRYGFYALLLIGLIVLCLIYIPKINAFLDKYDQLMNTLNDTADSVKKVSDSISTDTIESLNDFIDTVKKLLGRFGIN